MAVVKILLVDDEVAFTETMSKRLTARGHIVTEAHSGESAIRALEKGEFDVIVLDLKMPGMDGATTLKKIKKLGLFTETLILTAHGAVDSAIEAMKLGAYDYLTKPCEVDELLEKLEKAKAKKDDAKRRDLEEKTQRIVESPTSVLLMLSY